MCIPPSVIRETLESPEHTYEVSRYRDDIDARYAGRVRTIYTKGSVAIVTDLADQIIVTVLWNKGETEWTRNEIWQKGGWVDY